MGANRKTARNTGKAFAKICLLGAVIAAIPTHAATRKGNEANRGIASLSLTSQNPVYEAKREIRLAHARELLGKAYRKSVVKASESIPSLNEFVYNSVLSSLPKKHQSKARVVANAILKESARHGFDPIFLMAVIQNESSFNPDTIGGVGEIGLMQIRPTTAAWISKRAGVLYKGEKTLFNPALNIRIGAKFLAMLREDFDSQGGHYLAAYNMGKAKLKRNLANDQQPTKYATAVMKRYLAYYERVKADREYQMIFRAASDEVAKLSAIVASFR